MSGVRTGLTARILRLYGVYTALDSTLVARALGVSLGTASHALCYLERTNRVRHHRSRNARRTRVRSVYTLSGGTP